MKISETTKERGVRGHEISISLERKRHTTSKAKQKGETNKSKKEETRERERERESCGIQPTNMRRSSSLSKQSTRTRFAQ
ncbi:hypothetical protein EE612_057479 [Oryza sativa]|nr:hypothetical protein EE612_057479 [Oryza sativa]